MKSIIFVNYLPRDTNRLRHTDLIELNSLRFLGNLQLNLWDCGGQDAYMENYLDAQRESVFQNARVLIFVIGVAKYCKRGTEVKPEHEKDMKYFTEVVASLKEHSPSARVFCLLHKMDMVQASSRADIVRKYEEDLSKTCSVVCFPTSIWDDTLYKAWSNIVNMLVPDVDLLHRQVSFICEMCEADEVVIFEKNTFLVIAHSSRAHLDDDHRFERISNIVKQFKYSCGRAQTHFQSFQIVNSKFVATIEPFLPHSYIMVVVSDRTVPQAHTFANLDVARNHLFELAQRGGISFGVHL